MWPTEKHSNTWEFPKFQKIGNWKREGAVSSYGSQWKQWALPSPTAAFLENCWGQCIVKNANKPWGSCPPAHLDLDAEDGPVLGEAEGLQPREVGKAHRVTAQRVHVLVTATLWDSRGEPAQTGKLALGMFVHSGAVSFARWGVGTSVEGQDTEFISFSQLCTCTNLPSPLSTPGFSFLKTVPGTWSVPRAAVNGQLPAHPKKGEA